MSSIDLCKAERARIVALMDYLRRKHRSGFPWLSDDRASALEAIELLLPSDDGEDGGMLRCGARADAVLVELWQVTDQMDYEDATTIAVCATRRLAKIAAVAHMIGTGMPHIFKTEPPDDTGFELSWYNGNTRVAIETHDVVAEWPPPAEGAPK